jgi:hypothetical protein
MKNTALKLLAVASLFAVPALAADPAPQQLCCNPPQSCCFPPSACCK